MNDAIKPYLARSLGVHLAGLAAFAFLASRAAVKADKVYMIDFVGGTTATIQSAGASAPAAGSRAPAAPREVAAQTDPDAVNVKGRRRPIALPRPSLLRGSSATPDLAPAPESSSLAGPGMSAAPGPSLAPGPGASAGAASESAGVSTDLIFPYPWYISQVRLMLWQEWQKRMPRLDAQGDVSFAILRNGTATDLAVESSSGDAGFDKAALESVQAAAPFPALPSDFREPFLKIHLSLKSEEAWR